MRRIVQIAGTGNRYDHGVFALCEDGSLWHFGFDHGWLELPVVGMVRGNSPPEPPDKWGWVRPEPKP